jgi:hypothetical protein
MLHLTLVSLIIGSGFAINVLRHSSGELGRPLALVPLPQPSPSSIAASFSGLALATREGEKCSIKGSEGFCVRKKPCDRHGGKGASTDKCNSGEVCCLGLDTPDAKALLKTIRDRGSSDDGVSSDSSAGG